MPCVCFCRCVRVRCPLSPWFPLRAGRTSLCLLFACGNRPPAPAVVLGVVCLLCPLVLLCGVCALLCLLPPWSCAAAPLWCSVVSACLAPWCRVLPCCGAPCAGGAPLVVAVILSCRAVSCCVAASRLFRCVCCCVVLCRCVCCSGPVPRRAMLSVSPFAAGLVLVVLRVSFAASRVRCAVWGFGLVVAPQVVVRGFVC